MYVPAIIKSLPAFLGYCRHYLFDCGNLSRTGWKKNTHNLLFTVFINTVYRFLLAFPVKWLRSHSTQGQWTLHYWQNDLLLGDVSSNDILWSRWFVITLRYLKVYTTYMVYTFVHIRYIYICIYFYCIYEQGSKAGCFFQKMLHKFQHSFICWHGQIYEVWVVLEWKGKSQ